ncbi:MAG: hypothetical protein ACR652_01040 [Methylocystis sp.]|uniref:hypothetical protein n=1 Tax=Methylocystis sp. TaxID=1911079 RepID=UPI003DA61252
MNEVGRVARSEPVILGPGVGDPQEEIIGEHPISGAQVRPGRSEDVETIASFDDMRQSEEGSSLQAGLTAAQTAPRRLRSRAVAPKPPAHAAEGRQKKRKQQKRMTVSSPIVAGPLPGMATISVIRTVTEDGTLLQTTQTVTGATNELRDAATQQRAEALARELAASTP